MPPSRAPEMMVQGFRSTRHIVAYTVRGSSGANSRSAAPVLSET